MPIPFVKQFVQSFSGRMKDNHTGNVVERVPGRTGALSPVDIFGDINSTKRADPPKIRSSDDQISAAAKPVHLDVELEAVREHAFIRFESGNRQIWLSPYSHVAA